MRLNYDELKLKLNSASPLEIGNVLIQQELHDEKQVLQVLADIDAEIKAATDLVDNLLVPVFYTVVDSLLTKLPAIKNSNIAKTVTPSTVIEECRSFSYGEGNSGGKHAGVSIDTYKDQAPVKGRENFARDKLADRQRLIDYRNQKTGRGATKTAEDEYGEGRLYVFKKDLEKRNFHQKTGHMGNVDHVVPLKQKFTELQGNYALSDAEIKTIVNSEVNLAITSEAVNKSKGDKTNTQYVRENEDRLSEAARQKMIKRQLEAEEALNKQQNELVFNKITNNSGESQKIIKKAGADSLHSAAEESKNAALGAIIIEFIKVSYYEVTDIFKNGIRHNTGETSSLGAFKVRIGRAVKYIFAQCGKLISRWGNFVTNFIKALFDSIINLFAGFIKNAWNIIKRGITSIIQAIKILCADSAEMTMSEKCDAIMKLAITTTTMIVGEGLEAYISQIPVVGNFAGILTPIISGIISTVLIYLVDKLDIFGASIERKRKRIQEVFAARIADIQHNVDMFDKAALEVLVEQKRTFANLMAAFNKALAKDDLAAMADTSFAMARFFKVELGYENEAEFTALVAQEGNLKF